MTASNEWGRVDADGTVYVRTAEGERAVGSWHAGTPEDGLAHYTRRYDDLATEVALLESRLASGAGDPKATLSQATALRSTPGSTSRRTPWPRCTTSPPRPAGSGGPRSCSSRSTPG